MSTAIGLEELEYNTPFHIFSGIRITNYFDENDTKARQFLENDPGDHILNVDEAQFADQVYAEFKIANLEVDFDDVHKSYYERQIMPEEFPHTAEIKEGDSLFRMVIRFHLPYKGDVNLIRCMPTTLLQYRPNISVTERYFAIEVVNFDNNFEWIMQQYRLRHDAIRKQHQYLHHDVERYNEGLKTRISEMIAARKTQLQENAQIFDQIDFPVWEQE